MWSWHVWVNDYDPEANIFEWKDANGISYKYMDRNLGAMSGEKYSKESLGLLYQWGRKDPFPGGDDVESSIAVKIYDMDGNEVHIKLQERPTYSDYTSTNLQLAIENPDTFYYAPSSSWPSVDWLTDRTSLQDNDLWGGKTNACEACVLTDAHEITHRQTDQKRLDQSLDQDKPGALMSVEITEKTEKYARQDRVR